MKACIFFKTPDAAAALEHAGDGDTPLWEDLCVGLR